MKMTNSRGEQIYGFDGERQENMRTNENRHRFPLGIF